MVRRVAIDGTSVLGVFATCTEDLLVISPSITQEARHNLERELAVDSSPLFIGSSSVVGSLVTGNSNGFVVSSSASRSEIKQLKAHANGLKVRKLPGKISDHTANHYSGRSTEYFVIGSLVFPARRWR